MKSPCPTLYSHHIPSALSHLATVACPLLGNLIVNTETPILRTNGNITLKTYERTKMEFSKVELELDLKFPDESDADKTRLKSKLEMLAKRGDRLLREIRERAEKIRTLQAPKPKSLHRSPC